MSKNYDKSGSEEREPIYQSSKQLNEAAGNKARVVEIPVQHYTTPLISSSLPNNGHQPASFQPKVPQQGPPQQQHHHVNPADPFIDTSEFFNNRPSLFDDIQSPFDLLDGAPLRNRSLFRERPFGSRFDEFFRPHPLIPSQQPSVDSFFNRNSNSPGREFFERPNPSSSFRSSATNLADPYLNVNEQQQQQQPSRQSPSVSRTESPKRFTNQPVKQEPPPPPSQPQNNNNNNNPDSGSDFKHKIPVEVKSGSPGRQSTPPTKVNVDHIQQPDFPNMGNTYQSPSTSNKKPSGAAGGSDLSDFKHPHPQQQQYQQPPPPQQHQMPNQQASNVKTPHDQCNDVANELHKLEKEVNQFSGQRKDKAFLVLDEYLTRCLLRLDEIDPSDEKVKQDRKRLINYTHQLSERLEEKATSQSMDNSNDTGNGENPPSSKRPKSPNYENAQQTANDNSNHNASKKATTQPDATTNSDHVATSKQDHARTTSTSTDNSEQVNKNHS